MSVLSVFVSVLSVLMLFLPSRPFCLFLCPFCLFLCLFCPLSLLSVLCLFRPFSRSSCLLVCFVSVLSTFLSALSVVSGCQFMSVFVSLLPVLSVFHARFVHFCVNFGFLDSYLADHGHGSRDRGRGNFLLVMYNQSHDMKTIEELRFRPPIKPFLE